MSEGTPDVPVYSKFKQDEPAATQFWGINVDEGWRSWILCTDMYEWAADDLLRRLRAAPAERWPGALGTVARDRDAGSRSAIAEAMDEWKALAE